MTEENRMIGERLREYRKQKGMSITRAAAHIHVTPSFISMVENGKSGISFHRTHQLVTLYGKTLSDLTTTEKENASIINIHAAPVVATEPGVTIYGLTKKDGELHLGGFRMCFEPGAEHEFDYHEGYEYALIIEGDFQLRLKKVGEEKVEIREMHTGDTTIYSASMLHRWKNVGDGFGSLFVIEVHAAHAE